MKNNLFCPKWVFDICVGVTAYEYIVKDIPIDLSAKKFVRGINLRYKEVQLIEIKFAAESIIRFMGEINNPQYKPHERLRYFLFHTLKYETYYSKRKFKTLFGSAFDGTKEKKYSEELVLQDFKTYVFSLRSNLVKKAPKSWDIRNDNEQDLDFLGDLLNKDYSIDDLIEDAGG